MRQKSQLTAQTRSSLPTKYAVAVALALGFVLGGSLSFAGCVSKNSEHAPQENSVDPEVPPADDPEVLAPQEKSDEDFALTEQEQPQAGQAKPQNEAGSKTEPQSPPNGKYIGQPVNPVTEGASLPLPADIGYYTIRSFLDQSKYAYAQFAPLSKEFALYLRILKENTNDESEEVAALRFRLRENFQRTHWVFLDGIASTLKYLSQKSRTLLTDDKERYFVERMKAIVFLAKELDDMTQEEKYLPFAKKIYMSASKRHFGRELKPVGE